MNIRRFLNVAMLAALLSGSALVVAPASAQDPFPAVDDASKPASLFGPDTASSSTSSVRATRMSAAELRQARALYRANQRTARLEYNLWIGHEPLRPKWNAVPAMTSRYSARRILVPVYLWPR